MDIFIHHLGQFLSPDSRARVDIAPGGYKKIAINHEVTFRLNMSFAAVHRLHSFKAVKNIMNFCR